MLDRKRLHPDAMASASNADSSGHDTLPLSQRPARANTTALCSPLMLTAALDSLCDQNHDFNDTLSSSSSATSHMSNAWDTLKELEDHGLRVDVSSPLPASLQAHVDGKLLQCQKDKARSPNAKHLVAARSSATLDNELTAMMTIEQHLLFSGENVPDARRPVPKLVKKNNIVLSREYLPTSPPGSMLAPFTQPQSDTAIGYLTNTQALRSYPSLATAFTSGEESKLGNFTLNNSLLFPFLTAQWKPTNGEPHMKAQHQGARDGAAIVAYLDRFFTIAHGRAPTIVECYHLSITCDIETVMTWIHWRELDANNVPTYFMKAIKWSFLRDEDALLETRTLLHNQVKYAMGERVQSLKDALNVFKEPRSRASSRKRSKPGSTSDDTA